MALYERCLQRLAQLEANHTVDQARLFILHNLVRTYVPLTEGQRASLLERLEQEGAQTVIITETTWAERVRRQGREERCEEG